MESIGMAFLGLGLAWLAIIGIGLLVCATGGK